MVRSVRWANPEQYDIFRKINPSTLWVLGVVASDGVICYDKNGHYTVGFAGDKDVIEKIKSLIGCPHKIKKKHRACHYLYLNNKAMFTSLRKLGIEERKSLTLKFPNISKEKENVRHFIRGYFDGDGSVWERKDNNTKKKYFLETCFYSGSKTFIVALHKLLQGFGLLTSNPHFQGETWRIVLKHNGSLQLYKLMYEDVPDSYLGSRKKRKFEEIMAKTGEVPYDDPFAPRKCKHCCKTIIPKAYQRFKTYCDVNCRFNYNYHNDPIFKEKQRAKWKKRKKLKKY